MNRRGQKPKEIYKVDWVGKNPKSFYSVVKNSEKEAVSFAKGKEAMVYKLAGISKKSAAQKWDLVPTEASTKVLKAIKVNRKFSEKAKKGKGKSNATGSDTQIEMVSELSAEKSQKARLVSAVVVAPAIGYIAFKHDMPNWAKISLYVVAGGTFYLNAKQYLMNKKIEKIK